MTHYLEIIAELHQELNGLDRKQLAERAQTAPIFLCAGPPRNSDERQHRIAALPGQSHGATLFGEPHETFFTGGGVLHVENFDRIDNKKILELREAFRNSVNLVFIRLMRDVVAYHRAHSAYDAEDVLQNSANPLRQKMLQEIAEDESRSVLRRAYQNYAKQAPDEIVRRLIGTRGVVARRLTVLFFAGVRVPTWTRSQHGWKAITSKPQKLMCSSYFAPIKIRV